MNITIKGIDKLQKKLTSISDEVSDDVSYLTKTNAVELQNNAKQSAPIDSGDLKQSIIAIEEGKYTWSVGTNMPYAPFMEFGTGKKVDIPQGYEQMASAYKGGGRGSWKQFYENIKEWAKKKGIDEKGAYAIMLSIFRDGVKPRPFLINNYQKQQLQYLKDLKNMLKNITK